MYRGWDGGNPLGTGSLDTWGTANGATIRMGHEFGDNAQWSYFANGTNFANWNTWVGAGGNRSFGYSCPLIAATNPQDYAGLNAGTYDAHFTSLGAAFQAQPNLRNATIRLGWEFNGNSFPWQLPTNATNAHLDAYKSGFNRAAGLIRAGCSTVKFEWCPNAHMDNANRTFADMYPGNTYVDYIGVAIYDYYWPGGTPTQSQREAWVRDEPNGLADHWALAQAQSKPVAYTEWGLWPSTNLSGGGDRPAFITFFANWMRDHQAAYSQYNNVNATTDHRLDLYPNAKATYLSRFATGVLAG